MSDSDPHELEADELRASGLQQTTLERPTGRVVLTLEDVTTIQRSLHGYLVATNAPNSTWFEDRDYLLGTAQGAGWIDGGGVVRIGSWVLDGGQEPMVLRLRVPGLETAPVVRSYVAALVYDENWRVLSITQARIRRR